MQPTPTNRLLLRQARAGDHEAVSALLDQAFGGQLESQLVARIRAGSDYVGDFELLAELDGNVVGHVMLSYVELTTLYSRRRVLSLGPVAVSPAHQRQSIGSRLIEEALKRADDAGEEMTVLLGHPSFYPRFGFDPAWQHDVYPPLAWDLDDFMARISPGCRGTTGGIIHYPETWGINQTADGIDLDFRPAEKADMAQVARVFKISFRHSLPSFPVVHSDLEDRQYFETKVYAKDEIWVAVDTSGQAPTIYGFISVDDQFVNHLYVLPFARRRGIGERLLTIAKEERQDLLLWAFQKNKTALTFYERNGFIPVKFTDGAGNEEKQPDVLLRWQ